MVVLVIHCIFYVNKIPNRFGFINILQFTILFPHYDNENLFQCDENYKS